MLEQIITGASAGVAIAFALLIIAIKLWRDMRIERRLDAYIERLERRVVVLEAALLAAGIPLPQVPDVPTVTAAA